jgi:hypothetical protein
MILGQTVFVFTPDTWSWVRQSLSRLSDPGSCVRSNDKDCLTQDHVSGVMTKTVWPSLCHYSWHMILGQTVFVFTPDTWSWARQSLSLLLTHDPGSGSLCHYSWHLILGQAVFVITPDTWSWVRQSCHFCHYSWHMILSQTIFVITPDTWSWVRQSLSLLLTHDPGSDSLCHYSWHMILGQAVFVITPDTWSWVRQSLSLIDKDCLTQYHVSGVMTKTAWPRIMCQE